MAWTHSPERQLGDWIERGGNWRLMALLAAAHPEQDYTPSEIGEGLLYLERNPEVKQYHLAKRDDYDAEAPQGLQAHTLAAMPERRIRPLSAGYDNGDYQEPAQARELAASGDASFDERDLERGVSVDEYMGRMLVDGTTAQKDVLWREQLLDTVVMGAEEVQFARDNTNFLEVQTRQGDHPVRGDDAFAPKVAEGASIEFDELDWSQGSWNTDKYGLAAYITEELLDDGIVPLIEENVRHLGRAVENSFNRVTHNTLIDDANETVSATTSATDGIQNANLSYVHRARDAVVKDNWPEPDTLLMHNKFELGFIIEDRNNINFADRAGNGDYIREAALPEVANLTNRFVVPGTVYDGDNTYDWSGTSSDRGAVAYNRDLMFTYMYRDLETKEFDDPLRDLEGANVRAQFDAALGQTDSACVIDES